MATPIFPTSILPPSQQGYNIKKGREFAQVELEGGATRTRRDKIGATHLVTCIWECTPTQYTTLMGFFDQRLQSGTRVFRIPLLVDVPALVSHRAKLRGEPQELSSNQGLLHVVKATLEVIPNPTVSFGLVCQSVSDNRVINANNPDFTPSMDEFPIGRQVLLTGVNGVVDGTSINLDGTYTILSKPGAAICELQNAPAVNPGWTTLNGTVSQIMTPTNNAGACILLPE